MIGRCDSFVVETDVHFPTDINLLFDAIRKIIQICALITNAWTWSVASIHIQYQAFKNLYRSVQQLKRSTSKKEEKKADREALIVKAHTEYIKIAETYVCKAELTIETVKSDIEYTAKVGDLETYIIHAKRQIGRLDGCYSRRDYSA